MYPPALPFLGRVPNSLFCLFGRHFRLANEISLTYSLGSFQAAASALGPGANESVCDPFQSTIYIPYSPIALLDVLPIGFQSQVFQGLISLEQVPRAGVADEKHKAFAPLGGVPHL